MIASGLPTNLVKPGDRTGLWNDKIYPTFSVSTGPDNGPGGASPDPTWEQPYGGNTLPSQDEVYQQHGIETDTNDSASSADSASGENYQDQDGFSLSQYMAANPGASYEDILQYASQHSDEYAMMYLNYMANKAGLQEEREYNASRADTAYQRLVADLKAAGLNPAMMYGSSASTTTESSSGYVKLNDDANSKQVSNYSKLESLLLGYLSYYLDRNYKAANTIMKGLDMIHNWKYDAINSVLKIFGLG